MIISEFGPPRPHQQAYLAETASFSSFYTSKFTLHEKNSFNNRNYHPYWLVRPHIEFQIQIFLCYLKRIGQLLVCNLVDRAFGTDYNESIFFTNIHLFQETISKETCFEAF